MGLIGYIFPALLLLAWATSGAAQYKNCTGDISRVSNGFCDIELNDQYCGFDGGDCCECTCVDGPIYACNSSDDLSCKDPACLFQNVQDEFPECSGSLPSVRDGQCNENNNIENCWYDGGDCCLCTCVANGECSFDSLDCVDSGAKEHLYECQVPPDASSIPCSADVQRAWVVNGSMQARDLAKAVNCSGGAFNVEWRGAVELDKTIYVTHGTVLNITGVGTSNAVINGDLRVRLFTVANASLHISDVSLKSGFSVVGGAIAALASNVTLTGTSFAGNRASGMGGSIYVTNGSSVSIDGDTTSFLNNSAAGLGGAMYVSGSSIVSFSGKEIHALRNAAGRSGGAIAISQSQLRGSAKAFFTNNTGGSSGGAVDVMDSSTVSWTGNLFFVRNTAEEGGGAIVVRNNSDVSWSENSMFELNRAGSNGGSLNAIFNSRVSWGKWTNFTGNRAGGGGGTIALYMGSSAFWTGNASFENNSAGDGGAVLVRSSSSISWHEGTTIFSGNVAANELRLSAVESSSDEGVISTGCGGALHVAEDSAVLWTSGTTFTGNSAVSGGALFSQEESTVNFTGSTFFEKNSAGGNAASMGGALHAQNSSVSWAGYAFFSDNYANYSGGAISSSYSSVSWSGLTEFSFNSALAGSGGAMLVQDSSVSWNGNTAFEYNRANSYGGAIAVTESNISWAGDTTFDTNRANASGGAIYVHEADIEWVGTTEFVSNAAFFHGGALSLEFKTNVSWRGGTLFLTNLAEGSGGAVYGSSGTSLQWSGPTTTFASNTGQAGGALLIEESQLSWSGYTTFEFNRAELGGAIYIVDTAMSWMNIADMASNRPSSSEVPLWTLSASDKSWSSSTLFFNNSADWGGAVYVSSGSSVWWNVNTSFTSNTATVSSSVSGSGGAVIVTGSIMSWSGNTTFKFNRAAWSGGAIMVVAAHVSWEGFTRFESNTAELVAGAVYASTMADVSWSGVTSFFNNSASSGGAGAFIGGSNVRWNGSETSFVSNRAKDGGAGALYFSASNASWIGSTSFSNNYASQHGGGIYLDEDTSIDWAGETTFAGNIASSGGGVKFRYDAKAIWKGRTIFVSNKAEEDGGAVGSFALDSSADGALMSSLKMTGNISFFDNVCGINGGAIQLSGGLVVEFDPTANVAFRRNSAGAAGGAVFMTGSDVGPTFSGISFVSNSAKLGGGVHATSSGNSKINLEGGATSNPTRFERCSFVGNMAIGTGGAIQSAAGQDYISETSFVGNMAGTGGALFLAGTSNVLNCSFADNQSQEGAGPVASNFGYVASMRNCSFVDNAYNCTPGTFRAYNMSGNIYEVLCAGCEAVCEGCHFDDPSAVPYCDDEMAHSTSKGRSSTIDELEIHPGYWRATSFSKDVLACYNPGACLGGITGAPGYCQEGYEGPYCAICSNGYEASLGFTCEKCSKRGGVVLAVLFSVVAIFAFVLLSHYLVLGEVEYSWLGFLETYMGYVPLQAVKIVIVTWQILTQFVSVVNVTYPDVYERFLRGVQVLNFDLSWIPSVGCLLNHDFHDRLLVATIGPIAATTFLGLTYTVAARRNHGSDGALAIIRQKHLSAFLLLTFLVYSGVSSVIFQSFACDSLDDDKIYLRADYRIQCDSPKHEAFTIYAGFMAVLYPLGIPAIYAGLLFNDRQLLMMDNPGSSNNTGVSRENNPRVRPTSSLWKPYKPKRFYYEVIECVRRILLTGAVVFIYPNTAAQTALTLTIAFACSMASESLDPYASMWDTWVSRMGHVVIFLSLYVALLLKVDVSEERSESQKVLGIILVLFHVGMILAIVGAALALVCSFKATRRARPSPRFRRMQWIFWDRQVSNPQSEVAHESKGDSILGAEAVRSPTAHGLRND